MSNNHTPQNYAVVRQFFNTQIRPENIHFLLYALGFITLIEILSSKIYFFSLINSRIWIVLACLSFGFILKEIYSCFRDQLIKKEWISLAIVLLCTISLSLAIGNIAIADISFEATQQVASGLLALEKSNYDISGKGWLGYPTRQYLINALPSTLFGRNISSLHLGFALPFIAGTLVLYAALRKYCIKINADTRLSAFALLTFLSIPYIVEFYLIFEQTITPVSYTLLTIAALLFFLCEFSFISALALLWFGSMLCNSYTPALAAFGLLIVTMFYIALRRKDFLLLDHNSSLVFKSALGIGISLLGYLIASILSQRADRATGIRPEFNLTNSFINTAQFLTDYNAAFFAYLLLPALIYALLSFTFRLGKINFMIWLWVVGVMAAAVALQGYTNYEISVSMQRAMIVFPVLITAATLTIAHQLSNKPSSLINSKFLLIYFLFAIIFSVKTITQGHQYFKYPGHVAPIKLVIADLLKSKDKLITNNAEFTIFWITDQILMSNLHDYTQYFFPNAKVIVFDKKGLHANPNSHLPYVSYADNGIYKDHPSMVNNLRTIKSWHPLQELSVYQYVCKPFDTININCSGN